jgi:hypothetical protein
MGANYDTARLPLGSSFYHFIGRVSMTDLKMHHRTGDGIFKQVSRLLTQSRGLVRATMRDINPSCSLLALNCAFALRPERLNDRKHFELRVGGILSMPNKFQHVMTEGRIIYSDQNFHFQNSLNSRQRDKLIQKHEQCQEK